MVASDRDVSDTEDFFEMSLDNLCVAGIDGYFKRVNPSWTRTLGWTAAELLSRPSMEFVHPDDRAATANARRRLHDGLAMGPLTNRYACKDGSFRWFEWRSIAHPERELVYAAARDITDEKLARERLVRTEERARELERHLAFAERMASVGTLAGGVAHEINNPLASLTVNVAMILEGLEENPIERAELRAVAIDIQDAAERIRKIVQGLRTFSRADEERRVATDVHTALELATEMTAHKIRDQARLVRVYGETPSVHADEARLGQVFICLLVNAAQAFESGHGAANEIRILTTTDAEGRAVVEIRDNGCGVPESAMPRIFDPFFTTKPIGTAAGLGLSISHTIVTGMGGEISATSEPGHGTTVRVVLPAASAPNA